MSTLETERQETIINIDTSKGRIKVALDAQKAPVSVANFLSYIDDEFYTDKIFHRVIPNFMIQGGGYDRQFNEQETKGPIENEGQNGLLNKRGTLAMARTPDPHSASAQFFINLVDNDFLNYKGPDTENFGYAVFGKVIDGLDIIDAISEIPTEVSSTPIGPMEDVPTETVLIRKITRA